MLRLFFIPFNPNDISSTDGIKLSLGLCMVDLRTGEWKRVDENGLLFVVYMCIMYYIYDIFMVSNIYIFHSCCALVKNINISTPLDEM